LVRPFPRQFVEQHPDLAQVDRQEVSEVGRGMGRMIEISNVQCGAILRKEPGKIRNRLRGSITADPDRVCGYLFDGAEDER
jgi:hypothetical protein